MRQPIFVGLLIIFGFAAGIIYSREGLVSRAEVQAEIEAARQEIFGQKNISSWDIMTTQDDPQKMTHWLLTKAKKGVDESRGVPNQKLLQPISSLTSTALIDWEEKGFSITFYYEEIEKDSQTFKIIRTFQCSPEFVLTVSAYAQTPRNPEDQKEQYRRLKESPLARTTAEADALELQRLLDFFSSNDDLAMRFEDQSYEDWNFVFSREEAWMLRSHIGPYLVFQWFLERALTKDVDGLGVRSNPTESDIQRGFPLSIATRPKNKAESLRIRKEMLTQTREIHSLIQKSWPLAYGWYYHQNHLMPRLEKEADEIGEKIARGHWETRAFWLLVVVAIYFGLQVMPMSLSRIVREELESHMNYYPSPFAIKRTKKAFYRRHRWRLFWQPLSLYDPDQKTLRGLIAPLCQEEKDRRESEDIFSEAHELWQDIQSRFRPGKIAMLEGQFKKATGSGKLSLRRSALHHLLKAHEQFVSQETKEALAGETVEETVPAMQYSGTREALIAKVRSSLSVFAERDDPKFWDSFSRADLFRLQEVVNTGQRLGVDIASSLVLQPNLHRLLAEKSRFIASVRSGDRIGIVKALGIRDIAGPESGPEPESAIEDLHPLAPFKKAVIIGGRKQVTSAKERLVQAALDLGVKKAEFVFSEEIARVSTMVSSAGPNTLFIFITLAGHESFDALKASSVVWITVNTLNPDRFKAEVREQLHMLSPA